MPLTLIMTLLGCGWQPDANVMLMDKIEASIVMPAEASPLNVYARYYARDGDGSVRGVLTYPFPERSAGDLCEELGKGIVPCEGPDLPYPRLKAGERIWLSNGDDLPSISDGGCSVIEVLVPAVVLSHPGKRWEFKVQCNGR